MRKVAAVSIVCVGLTGCASLEGPKPIITVDGPAEPVSEATSGFIKRFHYSASSAAAGGSAEARMMFEDGITLVYANCSDYFASSGTSQTKLYLLKDAIAAVGTLAASAFAIYNTNGGDDGALAWLTFGTSAALTGVDIYTERFLFGAENVDSVRDLTLRALSAHADKVRERGPNTYQQAVRHLFDHQALCTPSRIVLMAREAIEMGRPVASVSPTPVTTAPEAVEPVQPVTGTTTVLDANERVEVIIQ